MALHSILNEVCLFSHWQSMVNREGFEACLKSDVIKKNIIHFFLPSWNKRIAEVSDYSINSKFKDNEGRFNIEAKKLFKTKLSI